MTNIEVTRDQLKKFLNAIKLKDLELRAMRSVAKDLADELEDQRCGGFNFYDWAGISYEDYEEFIND